MSPTSWPSASSTTLQVPSPFFFIFFFIFFLFSLLSSLFSLLSSLFSLPLFSLLSSLFSLLCLLFHLLFSSLFFSPLFFSPLLSFLLSSVIMGHTQRRNSNTCQEPGPTEMSDGMRSTNICQKPYILSCLVLSCLLFLLSLSSFSVFFLCLLSLSSFSVFFLRVIRVWPSVVWCVPCGVVCAVWCGTLKTPVCRLKTLSVCRFKTSPCVPATRGHAFSACGRGAGTHRGRFECTHGKRFESTHGGHRQFCLQRTAHGFTESDHWMLPMFKFEKRSRTTCSRFLQSFALPDKAVKQQLLWDTLEGTSREMVRFVFRSHEKSIANDLRVSIS